jgi:transcription antitermination factor NusG
LPVAPQEQQAINSGRPEHSADNRAGWYILRCGAGLDFPAEKAVRNAGWNVFLARERKWRVSLWRRKPSEGEAEYPRFPGYLFVLVQPPYWPRWDSWPLERCITGILSMAGRPVALAPGEMARLRAEDGAIVPHAGSVPVHRAFALGQSVRVLAGPFRDHIAALDAIDERGAHITVQLFGRPAQVPLPLTWLEAA